MKTMRSTRAPVQKGKATAKPVSVDSVFPGATKKAAADEARYQTKLMRLLESGVPFVEKPEVNYSEARAYLVGEIITARDSGDTETRDAKLAELRALDAAFEEEQFDFPNELNESVLRKSAADPEEEEVMEEEPGEDEAGEESTGEEPEETSSEEEPAEEIASEEEHPHIVEPLNNPSNKIFLGYTRFGNTKF